MNRPNEEELHFYIACYTTSKTRGEIGGADQNYENCFEKSREDGNINKLNKLKISRYRIPMLSSKSLDFVTLFKSELKIH